MQQTKDRHKNPQVSIHPCLAVRELLGKGSTLYQQALEVFAWGLAHAGNDNEVAFSEQEWGVLAHALNGVLVDPASPHPGAHLAGMVFSHERFGGVGLGDLGERVGKLDSPHAWALVYAVRWYWAHHEMVGAEDPWWRVNFRRYFGGA